MDSTDLLLETEYYILRVGLKIKNLRLERGWSQEVLAEKMGTSRQRISKMEKGKYALRLGTLVRLAIVFEMDIKDFMPSFKD